MLGSIRRIYLEKKREEYYKSQRWEELAEACRGLIDLSPKDFHAMHDLVVSLKECKRLDEAYPLCGQALSLAPKTPPEQILSLQGPRYLRYLIVAAEIFLHRGEVERAKGLLLPLKRLGTTFHKKHLLLSEALEKSGDLSGAAFELEEMRELYASRNIHQWEHVILSRVRSLLPLAREKADADAFFLLTRVTARCRERIGELDGYIEARAADPGLELECHALKGHRGLIRGTGEQTYEASRALEARWAGLAGLYFAAWGARWGKPREAMAKLQGLPASGRARLELLESLRTALMDEPLFLRELSTAWLSAGKLEDAFSACQAITTNTRCELSDLARTRDVLRLLLDRAIWEDEARLGLRPEVGLDVSGRPDLSAVTAIPLDGPYGRIQAEVSAGFRLAAGHVFAGDTEVRLRLAENYLKRGAKAEAAVKLLEESARPRSPVEGKALCLLALQRIRAKDPGAAAAVERFRSASDRLSAEDRKRMLLDLGDAAEAAGSRAVSSRCYADLLQEDPAYADVRERVAAQAKAPPLSMPREAEVTSLRERFQDLKPIGRGGMGLVFKAFDPLFGRNVALKVLAESFRGDAAAVARFVREGQAMAQLLKHPGIARVYEVGAGRDLYLAMEHIEGPSLREVLRKFGPLRPARITILTVEICDALGFAHQAGVIHRDIKPDNILLAGENSVKLLDFGLADIAQATALTRAGSVMGTSQYMAPEQIKGGDSDARTDLYALGVSLYELAAGKPPFFQGDLSYQHLNETPRPLGQAVPGFPAGLEAAVMKCLEKDPARRPQTCAELAALIRSP